MTWVETSYEQCDSGLYTLECHLCNNFGKDVPRFETSFILEYSRYGHTTVRLKQA